MKISATSFGDQNLCACKLSCVQPFVTPWNVACQAPLSMGFSRQKYWSGSPFPSPEDLPDPEIKPESPTIAGKFFTMNLNTISPT